MIDPLRAPPTARWVMADALGPRQSFVSTSHSTV
jgi:hypothetical protein